MDDVNYLKKHAELESFLFVVDSSQRDKSVYVEPNEYEIKFNAPFQKVVGLDLIDASVPRTEYLVEQGANVLHYTYAGTRYSITVPPADYNILQLIEALNVVSSHHLTARPVSTPAELSNKVSFVADSPFTVHAESSLGVHLGLGTKDLASTPSSGALGRRTILQGPLPTSSTVVVSSAPISQVVTAPTTGAPAAALVYVRTTQDDAEVKVAVVNAANDLVEEGIVTIATPTEFEPVEVAFTASVPMLATESYRLVIRGSAGVFVYVDGAGVSVAQGPSLGGLWWKYASWSQGSSDVCVSLDMNVDGHVVQCPGLVNLTGEPYVLVRCPDIEQYLYRDRAFETVHAGMGMVKLGNQGFREQRYDFVSFPPRRLPIPIGKLGKLTIRLERGDGTLYDTKGVDHHLLFVIKYLEMTGGPNASTPSQLNPHYDPNPLTFLQRSHNNMVRRA